MRSMCHFDGTGCTPRGPRTPLCQDSRLGDIYGSCSTPWLVTSSWVLIFQHSSSSNSCASSFSDAEDLFSTHELLIASTNMKPSSLHLLRLSRPATTRFPTLRRLQSSSTESPASKVEPTSKSTTPSANHRRIPRSRELRSIIELYHSAEHFAPLDDQLRFPRRLPRRFYVKPNSMLFNSLAVNA